MGRRKGEKTQVCYVNIPVKWVEALDTIARYKGNNRSVLIRAAIRDFLIKEEEWLTA